MIRTTQPFPAGTFETTDKYVGMVDAIDPAAFFELTGFDAFGDGVAVEQDSRAWAERFFQPAASPYRPEPIVRHSFYFASGPSFDLLRHELRVGELDLVVTESVRFVLVSVRAPNLPALGSNDNALAQAITDLGEQILVMNGTSFNPFGQSSKYQWTLQYEAPLREGSRFTTAPQTDPALVQSHAERLDGGIQRGLPFFLGYKARGSGDGRRVFLDGRHWFDGKCWKPYERSPRR
jgi:hypothetical protein